MHSGHIKIITVEDYSRYEAGDILCACNHNGVRKMAGWKVCGERLPSRQFAGLNRHGFVPHDHLLKDWQAVCREIMLERLNKTQVRLTSMSDLREVVVTTGEPYTDFGGQTQRHMHVEQFFARRIQTFQRANGQGVPLFSDSGDVNRVVMYGGKTTANVAEMDVLWAVIEFKTDKLEATETSYENHPPFGSPDGGGTLIVRVDDFSDAESGELTSALLDETDPDNPVELKRRSRHVDWQNDLGMSAGEVIDVTDSKKLEHIATEQARDTIVKVKP